MQRARAKSDGCSDLTFDHLKHGGTDLTGRIALLLNSILMHDTLPGNFVISYTAQTVPISKGRNVNAADGANFRGIALSSIYGKLFDNIVLCRFEDKLQTSQLQFGFKAKSSTNLCTFVLKEALSYYVTNHSNVFCSFLDATKAFDRINYCKLFRLLLKRDLVQVLMF